MNEKIYDLEERLIDFSVMIIRLVETLPNTKAAQHLGGQLLRSGTSPALNYAEAKSAEFRNDFIHKMKVCLKELRESYVCLKIIQKAVNVSDELLMNNLITECNELISIFVKSINTASRSKSK
jgi:four helix bundle protein